jgi:predicted nicotinamide N-methyase
VPVFDTERAREFVVRNTTLQRPPAVPELALHLGHEITPLWEMTEAEMQDSGLPPPFWAFAWAGGQAVARYLLDHPAEVAGRRVLDIASGSGLVAIAARLAGARTAVAADTDPFCAVAVALNAAANGVAVDAVGEDLLDDPVPDVDVITAGDICYERAMTYRMLRWLRAAHERGVRVLLGDPGRTYLPTEGLVQLAMYDVPTTPELEQEHSRWTAVYTFGGVGRSN